MQQLCLTCTQPQQLHTFASQPPSLVAERSCAASGPSLQNINADRCFLPPLLLPPSPAPASCPLSPLLYPTQPPTHPQDVVESADAFTLHADAPGFNPEDISVEMNDGTLTISGKRKEEKTEEKEGKVRPDCCCDATF